MAFVISCGDEGVQINEGTRLAFVGSGFRLDGFSEVISILKRVFGTDISVAASEENDWIKKQLDLSNWEQVNASAQQHIEALADREGLDYAGFLPFTDPKQLKSGIKGHMVRPHGIHIANKVCLTVGGGEQKYNLGHFVISADWVSEAATDLVKKVLDAQIAFYQSLVRDQKLEISIEETGTLGEDKAQKNKAVLQNLGYIA